VSIEVGLVLQEFLLEEGLMDPGLHTGEMVVVEEVMEAMEEEVGFLVEETNVEGTRRCSRCLECFRCCLSALDGYAKRLGGMRG
jgi:hypothetical protein